MDTNTYEASVKPGEYLDAVCELAEDAGHRILARSYGEGRLVVASTDPDSLRSVEGISAVRPAARAA